MRLPAAISGVAYLDVVQLGKMAQAGAQQAGGGGRGEGRRQGQVQHLQSRSKAGKRGKVLLRLWAEVRTAARSRKR